VLALDADLYGRSLRVGFVQRLRDERAFPSIDLLKAQIAADVARARVLFGHLSL
jgi:riboflavin kinase / FMN adenylyltransferase